MAENIIVDPNGEPELTLSNGDQPIDDQNVLTGTGGEMGSVNYDITSGEIVQTEEETIQIDPAILRKKVETVIRSVEESSREIIHKWSEFLTEGEEFEELCLQRLDQLISEAKMLEEAILDQKHKLFERTQLLAKILCKYES
ncbi:hypothetical protein LOD99_1001 [Oopsacas minuta]|uniref:Uncharacterized protein n=1 Tax=Oopsacas minuta TaxID=111878 RepID=A0AAV7K1G2_9METZ|nr:hypothetical protein LOD99_1001 [Oopsacas minuta]